MTDKPHTLACACCLGEAPGRQWWNQDTGYGVCRRCADWIEEREGSEYVKECYGHRGHHFDVHDDSPCPASDPSCEGGEGDCHDACEPLEAPPVQGIVK